MANAENCASQEWRTLYEAAVLELDPVKLLERIAQAKQAIMDRTVDLHWSEDGAEDMQLLFALNALQDLRKMAESDGKSQE